MSSLIQPSGCIPPGKGGRQLSFNGVQAPTKARRQHKRRAFRPSWAREGLGGSRAALFCQLWSIPQRFKRLLDGRRVPCAPCEDEADSARTDTETASDLGPRRLPFERPYFAHSAPCQLGLRVPFASRSGPFVRTPVAHLLRPCSPAAIPRLIATVVLTTVECVGRGRLRSQVSEKAFKTGAVTVTTTPAPADGNSAPSIVFVGRLLRVRAASAHSRPAVPFRSAVFVLHFASPSIVSGSRSGTMVEPSGSRNFPSLMT
jgi:hypothetical protein